MGVFVAFAGSYLGGKILDDIFNGIMEVENLEEDIRFKVKEFRIYYDKLLKPYVDNKTLKDYTMLKDLIIQEILKNPSKYYNNLVKYDTAVIALKNQITSNDSTKQDIDLAKEDLANIKDWQSIFVEAFNEAIRKNPTKFEALYNKFIQDYNMPIVRGVDLNIIDDIINKYDTTNKAAKNTINVATKKDISCADNTVNINVNLTILEKGNQFNFPSISDTFPLITLNQDLLDINLDKIYSLVAEKSIYSNMPFKFDYNVSSQESNVEKIQDNLEKYSEMSETVVEAAQDVQVFNQASTSLANNADGLKRSMTEYQEEIDSTKISADELNESFQQLNSGDNFASFSKTLYQISDACAILSKSFMNVDEKIGKAIGSAGGLAASISKIYSAVSADPLAGVDTKGMTQKQIEAVKKQREKQNGLAIMAGIQGAFAGLQGLFGGEAGSDTSELLGGLGGLGAGVAGLLTANPIEGITSLISGLPSLLDGLFESTQEGYVKQLSKQGFNDTYSEDLLDKMSEVADRMGDKTYGIKAYIEDFFKETNIDNEEEFSRMSDLLSGSIGEYIAQGHTNDEAYEKFGDELEQLVAAQEKYGYETTASLSTMVEIQKTQTKAGRIEEMTSALGGFEKIIFLSHSPMYSDLLPIEL